MIDHSLAHPRATATGNRSRYLRGVELANRKASEYPYVQRPSRVGEQKYRVPSCTRDEVRYKVDIFAGTCECEDHRRGYTCKHLIAAMILESRRRTRMSHIVTCSVCPARIPYGDTTEVSEEHVSWGFEFFGGEIICPECVRRSGLL